MLTVFEVYFAPGADPAAVLSADMRRETNAQVMTIDEAKKVGFAGFAPDAHEGELRLVACARRDAPWVHRTLESSEAVARFKMHDVDA